MTTDARTIRIVVLALGIVVLALVALVGVIAVHDTPTQVPEALWSLLGVGIGALAAMLSRTTATPGAVNARCR